MNTWCAKLVASFRCSFVLLFFICSESTLVVLPRRVVIKTCGSTTLLRAVPKVLEIAKSCGFESVESVFYTRKNFLEPERQLFPHNNFENEVSCRHHDLDPFRSCFLSGFFDPCFSQHHQ